MILSKSEYLTKINSLLEDNSTQLISPLDIRISLTDLIDSVHLFLDGNEIVSSNFATPDTRTTRAGEFALDKLQYAGRTSVDNSAFGYYSLGANYTGSENTAIGSHSLGCNLYGTYNAAVGFNSSAAITTGSGNSALGSLALQSLRTGSFNIAIGHGAGSHIPTGDSYKFYLGVDPIDKNYTCDDFSTTSGAMPLMYGDLQGLRLGIATQRLHNYGVLQVSGDVTPSASGFFNVGNRTQAWASFNEMIHFSGDKIGINTSAPSGAQGILTVKGNIVPNEDNTHTIGSQKLRWNGYFNDITVSGRANISALHYDTINECLYDCKTLHLATSGFCDTEGDGFHNTTVCGYLTDESLDGAGFEIHSSGYDYRRDYKFIYKFPDSNLTCLEADDHYSRSRWQSNISIELESGRHLQTDRVLGDATLSLATQSGCYGLFSRSYHPSGNRGFATQQPHVDASYPTVQDFNFIGRSGTHLASNGNPVTYDYGVLYGTVDSGVNITHEFASRMKTTAGKRGFSIVYYDVLDAVTETPAGPDTDTGTVTVRGSILFGEAGDNDYFGWVVELSDDGSTVAISAPYSGSTSVGTEGGGYVKVHEWDGSDWAQKGDIVRKTGGTNIGAYDLDTNGNGNFFIVDSSSQEAYQWSAGGWSRAGDDFPIAPVCAMNEQGNRVVIGNPFDDTISINSGKVAAYQYDSTRGKWDQMGTALYGADTLDTFGTWVAMSADGLTIYISAERGGSNGFGYVRAYTWTGSEWVQKGSDILGTFANNSTYTYARHIAVSDDGNTVVVSEPMKDHTDEQMGRVYVYKFNTSTNEFGVATIVDTGGGYRSKLGKALTMNAAGDRIAVAGYTGGYGGPSSRGEVRIYDFDGTSWNQTYATLIGDDEFEEFGKSISLNDTGNILAVGSPRYDEDDDANINKGKVTVYNL